MDPLKGMQKYLKRLGESHPKVLAKLLAKREIAGLDDLASDDMFAFAEEFRSTAGLPNAFMLARKAGISLASEVRDTGAQATARALNSMAVKLYVADDTGTDLRDAVADGASVQEAMDQMGTAANTLRRADAKRGDPTGRKINK